MGTQCDIIVTSVSIGPISVTRLLILIFKAVYMVRIRGGWAQLPRFGNGSPTILGKLRKLLSSRQNLNKYGLYSISPTTKQLEYNSG